jgi:hypothetical protein
MPRRELPESLRLKSCPFGYSAYAQATDRPANRCIVHEAPSVALDPQCEQDREMPSLPDELLPRAAAQMPVSVHRRRPENAPS